MIAMRPIDEPDVLSLLNDGRFPGDLEGYVVMEGPQYLGHMLYCVQDGVTHVLECGLQDTALVDGGVRACVAAGENAGAGQFCVRMEDAKLSQWANIFLKGAQQPAPNEKIFTACK